MKNNMIETLRSEMNFTEGYELWNSSIEMGIVPDTTKGFMNTNNTTAEDQLYSLGCIVAIYEGI